MLDGIPVVLIDGIGIVGVLVLFILGVGTGRIFVKRQYDDVAHDRDEWRAESRIKDSQMAVKDEQIAEKDLQLRYLSEVGETQKAVLSAVQQIGRAG